jgi:hypothetical protein
MVGLALILTHSAVWALGYPSGARRGRRCRCKTYLFPGQPLSGVSWGGSTPVHLTVTRVNDGERCKTPHRCADRRCKASGSQRATHLIAADCMFGRRGGLRVVVCHLQGDRCKIGDPWQCKLRLGGGENPARAINIKCYPRCTQDPAVLGCDLYVLAEQRVELKTVHSTPESPIYNYYHL